MCAGPDAVGPAEVNVSHVRHVFIRGNAENHVFYEGMAFRFNIVCEMIEQISLSHARYARYTELKVL